MTTAILRIHQPPGLAGQVVCELLPAQAGAPVCRMQFRLAEFTSAVDKFQHGLYNVGNEDAYFPAVLLDTAS